MSGDLRMPRVVVCGWVGCSWHNAGRVWVSWPYLVPDGGAGGANLMIWCLQEKAMGNRPMEMMDREKAYIPELQISFMEHIAMPIYK